MFFEKDSQRLWCSGIFLLMIFSSNSSTLYEMLHGLLLRNWYEARVHCDKMKRATEVKNTLLKKQVHSTLIQALGKSSSILFHKEIIMIFSLTPLPQQGIFYWNTIHCNSICTLLPYVLHSSFYSINLWTSLSQIT